MSITSIMVKNWCARIPYRYLPDVVDLWSNHWTVACGEVQEVSGRTHEMLGGEHGTTSSRRSHVLGKQKAGSENAGAAGSRSASGGPPDDSMDRIDRRPSRPSRFPFSLDRFRCRGQVAGKPYGKT